MWNGNNVQHYAVFCLNILRSVSAATPFVPDMTEQLERIHEEAFVSALQEPFALPTGQDVVLDEVIAEVVQFGNPVLMRCWHRYFLIVILTSTHSAALRKRERPPEPILTGGVG